MPNLQRLAAKWGETLAALPRLPREEFGSTPGPLVAWEGSFFLHHSLAGINRAVCAELTRAGVDLTLTPFEADEIDPAALPEGPRLAALIDRPAARPPAVRVRHRFPPDFSRGPGERLACIQPWEFGAVPTAWAEAIRQSVDELWVPSEFVRKSFIAGGVPSDRVVTIPNGFDPAVFHAEAPPRMLPTGKSFRFLFVGGTIHRKGIDLLLRAYAEEFTAADDVALIVKDHAYYRHRIDGALEALRRRPGAPEIVYLHDNVAPGELGGLYTACDWLVHPFRGEGFGLPVLEALACARPVIVTDAGPIREYCPADAALFVPARTTGFPDASIDGLPTVGVPTLVEPDLGALRWAMRTAYESGEGGRALGRRGAEHVHAHYTWRQVATHYASRLRALCGSPEEAPAPPVAARAVTADPAPSAVAARPAAPAPVVAPAPVIGPAPAVAPRPVVAAPARRAPQRSELEVHRALTLIAEGHLAEGLQGLSVVLDRDPANVGALVGAAHCALVVDDTPNARALLTRVLELEPEHSGARAALDVLDGAAAADAAGEPALPMSDPLLAHEAL